MPDVTKPTIGRAVHLVVRDEGGRLKHRAATVAEVLPTGDGYDVHLHAMPLPGDAIPGGFARAEWCCCLALNVRRGVEGAEEEAALVGTWHWPEGTPDARAAKVGEKTK